MAKMEPIFLTIKEASEVIRVSRWTLYKLLDDGKIAGQYQGRRRMVRVESLKAYADSLPTEAPESVA